MTDRPNVLVMTSHDSGRHFGCYRRRTVHTPHVDRLAAQGVQLDQHFAAVPICCASRASMMTGLHPQRHGLLDLCFPPFNWEMGDDVLHLSQHMQRAGYHTHLFGRQHETKHIQRLGFDVETPGENPSGGWATCDVVAHLVRNFLEHRTRTNPTDPQPFFAQIGFFETHTPFSFGGVEPDRTKGVDLPAHLDPTDPTNEKEVAHLQGALRKLDQAVGVILDALEATGQADNTIVVFTTDHGLELPRAKWHLYDPGIEVACVWRWPAGGIAGGRRVEQLTSHVDFVPTVLDLVGETSPARLDGRSITRLLRGDTSHPLHDAIYGFYQKASNRCVRTKTHKLIRSFDFAVDHKKPVRFDRVLAVGTANQVQLYDLINDPVEFDDVADQPAYADVRAQLEAMLWRHLEAVNDPILQGPLRTPSYERAMNDYAAWKQAT